MSLRNWMLVFDIEKKPWISAPIFKFDRLGYSISGPISKVGIRYRRKNLRYRRFQPSLPPDIKGFYLILVAILNTSWAISSIYRCRAPNHFYSISNVSSINIFHILMSCTICDADIGNNLKLKLVGRLWTSSSHKVMTRWKHTRNN